MLGGEVRDIGVLGTASHRQVDDAFHARFAGHLQRVDGPGQLVGRVAPEQEQRVRPGKGRTHRIAVQQIAADGGDTGGKAGRLWRAGERADLRAACGELSDDLGADAAGTASDEMNMMSS